MTRKDSLFFFCYGFVVWALATISFKFIGLNQSLMLINFLALIVGMPLLNLMGYRWRNIKGTDRIKASVWFSIPGLMIDAFVILFYYDLITPEQFPLMPTKSNFLGAWLLFGYGITLITGVISAELTKI